MNRRRAALALAATVAAGLALMAVGIARGELADPRLVQAPLHAAVAYAYFGVWAETRGVVTARTWLTRPDRTLRTLVDRLAHYPQT
jgi:hypothetical protein